MTRGPVSHVDRGQLFGLTADGAMYFEPALELVAEEPAGYDRGRPPAGEELDSLEDREAGHRPSVPDPEAGRGDVIKACEWCHADCYWDHFKGRWCHD